MNRSWLPPGKNCGLCGEVSCRSFLRSVQAQEKFYEDCPFYKETQGGCGVDWELEATHPERDVLGHGYDFVLQPLPGEISARKIVLPFRGDLVEKLEIREGDLVVGRPMGAGCPIPHVLRVIEADPITGLLTTWVVGPKFARDGQQEVKNVSAYHMVGFEGIATAIRKEPTLGCRMTFLPGFCMMSLNHTGLVNMVLQKSEGPHIRIENILILATRDWD
ncbi:Fe-S cluster protein [Heliobacterium gestii]|uniref:Fe-S cluster protein n=1 Tax=Heliomicrobium gestii TaxID=2699 RepID=A0A845LBY7_HELGE|nr:(Fe-S)-binding protein [Heliomicrobium gestii]MBM7868147.1 putative Fe-S cluster-containing protein [Heliomicrobium gestii]MZP44327.1 Fe-S cluster protein [Heliomicrobium gestii]